MSPRGNKDSMGPCADLPTLCPQSHCTGRTLATGKGRSGAVSRTAVPLHINLPQGGLAERHEYWLVWEKGNTYEFRERLNPDPRETRKEVTWNF